MVDGYEVVDVGGRRLSASPDPGLTPEDVKQQNPDLLVDVLEGADLPYFLVRGSSPMRHRVGVMVQHRSRLLTLLAGDCEGRAVYAARLRGSSLGDVALATDVDGLDAVGRRRPARVPGGCQARRDVGALWRVRLRPRVLERRSRFLSSRTSTSPSTSSYTWVDGNDPEWLARRGACLGAADANSLDTLSTDASRFTDRDELKYSLRSLASHAPFVRNVYVATADQAPAWLRTDHPRLRVVSHREIFAAPEVLPTFNSHAIESQLHHIDGLRALPVPQPEQGDSPLVSSGKNNRELIESQFGRRPVRLFQHVAHPQLRSVLLEMEGRFPEEFRRTAAHRFRHLDDISVAAALHHDYAYLTRRAVPATLRHAYVDIAEITTVDRLTESVAWATLDVFCLNDKDSRGADRQAQATAVRGFLDRCFPHKSEFEK